MQFYRSKYFIFFCLFFALVFEYHLLEKMFVKRLFEFSFESNHSEFFGGRNAHFVNKYERSQQRTLSKLINSAGFDCRSLYLEVEPKIDVVVHEISVYCQPLEGSFAVHAQLMADLLKNELVNNQNIKSGKVTSFSFSQRQPSEFTELQLFLMSLLFSLVVSFSLPLNDFRRDSGK